MDWHHRTPSTVYNAYGFVYQGVIYARVNRWKNKGWEPELRLLLPRFDFNARSVAHVITRMSSEIALMQIEKYKWPLIPWVIFLNQLALSKLEGVQIIQLLTSFSHTSMIVYKLSSIDATQDSGAADWLFPEWLLAQNSRKWRKSSGLCEDEMAEACCSVDKSNTFFDLHDSSHDTQPHSIIVRLACVLYVLELASLNVFSWSVNIQWKLS